MKKWEIGWWELKDGMEKPRNRQDSELLGVEELVKYGGKHFMNSGILRVLVFVVGLFSSVAVTGCRSESDIDDAISEKILYDRQGLYIKEWDGTRQFGTAYDDTAGAVSVDGTGDNFDVLVAGSSQASADNRDIFLTKYDFSGDKKWSVDMKTTGDDVVHGLFDDGVGVLVAGRTNGFFEADEEGKNNGGYDVFLARYNYSGDELWTDHLGTATDDIATDVYVDDDNNVYVTGYTFGDLFDTESTKTANTADLFLVRYTGFGYIYPGGEMQLKNDSNTYPIAMAVDDNGSKYVAGYTDGTIYSLTHSGNNDGFLIKYSSLNVKQFAMMFGSTEHDGAVDVVVDSRTDAVYITGYTYGAFSLDGTSDANLGGSDAYLIKLNESGTQVWKKSIATSADDFGEGIALDKDGNICVAGSTSGNLDGNTNAGGSDVFLVKYDSGGNWLWSRLIGTGSRDSSADVTIDVSGNIYVTGTTYGALDGHTNLGSGDMFLVRFNASGEKQ